MELNEPSRAPSLKGEGGSLRSPLPASRPPSWRSRVAGHFRSWSYVYVLLAIALYSQPFLRGQFRDIFHRHVLDDRPILESAEWWTEWSDVGST
jgi:hypothetical protein